MKRGDECRDSKGTFTNSSCVNLGPKMPNVFSLHNGICEPETGLKETCMG